MAITANSTWNVNLGLAQPAANPVGGAGPAAWWNPLSGSGNGSSPSVNVPVIGTPAPGTGSELAQLAGDLKPFAIGGVAGFFGRDALVRNVVRRTRRTPSYHNGYSNSFRTPRRASANSGPKVRMNSEGFMANMLGAAKVSALVAGAISVFQHGSAYMRGQTTFAVAAAEVTNDTAAGAIGGVAGAAASTAACTLLAGMVGTGFGLTLVGLVAGIAAYSVVDSWFRSTQFSLKLRSTVHGVFA